METLEKSEIWSKLPIKTAEDVIDVTEVVLVFLLLTFNIFRNCFKHFYCWILTSKF